ncbi:hypothetical protein OPW41_09110 [Vibrio europaeus]|uniref:Uncharacterized protein n=1 Tax=Vibrio europaeus TaxID=300876 RepID=A0A178J689_9VIBR|nr:hypothetical protein [Vibrio europaeus]MDC5705974.1 hypothetical protein [Vibrio europaeus]MDC5709384.1 hypothetical protein [Vibrio europaeus]MDC5713783.1 hypothetical protein [Vibrio europaeus]MDC5720503.1 hypothetical protein [Vibrio europaeus]MDC5723610.1 hypothetical protein [Vibrio europaeus]
MKLNGCVLLGAVLLSATKVASAADAQKELFLFSLPAAEEADMLVAPEESNIPLMASYTSLPVELDYNEPCDIKCGVSTTGLVLLHMIAEGKADQEYRYSLMNPNYEP